MKASERQEELLVGCGFTAFRASKNSCSVCCLEDTRLKKRCRESCLPGKEAGWVPAGHLAGLVCPALLAVGCWQQNKQMQGKLDGMVGWVGWAVGRQAEE